ncbi:hypothetical protein N7490_006269 [Penicillium lividum]|nr:hypothetical protein N7490_006269 [Penicillium lividum]
MAATLDVLDPVILSSPVAWMTVNFPARYALQTRPSSALWEDKSTMSAQSNPVRSVSTTRRYAWACLGLLEYPLCYQGSIVVLPFLVPGELGNDRPTSKKRWYLNCYGAFRMNRGSSLMARARAYYRMAVTRLAGHSLCIDDG